MNRFLTLLASCLLAGGLLHAQFPTLSLVEIEDGFSSPVAIANADDGSNRLFVVERAGRIRVFDQNTGITLGSNFLDIQSRVRCCGERGLLGLTFHPDYATNGKLYVNYTVDNDATLADGTTIIAEFTNSNPAGNSVAANSERRLLTINQPFSNHNAGDLSFGPDGYLWIPLGDGGSGGDPGNRSQNTTELLGKMLRIDVDNQDVGLAYAIPADNPFVGQVGFAPEIWGIGLRNPWRIDFDGNALWIADVGQNTWEEVNLVTDVTTVSGLNWGWRCREGNNDFNTSGCLPASSYEAAAFEYSHSDNNPNGGSSITGGKVYRGTQFTTLDGVYICADILSTKFYLLRSDANGNITSSDIQVPLTNFGASTFGEDEAGELYVANLGGSIYQVQASPALPVEFSRWEANWLHTEQQVDLSWTTTKEENSSHFIIERANDYQENFRVLGRVNATGNSLVPTNYQFTDIAPDAGRNYYRLRQVDADGATKLTPVRTIFVGKDDQEDPIISPNPVGNQPLNIWLPEAFRQGSDLTLHITNLQGQEVARRVFYAQEATTLVIDLSADLPKGTYLLQLSAGEQRFSGQFVR